MNEQEIKIFVDAVTHYFSQLGEEKAKIRTSFLSDNHTPLPLSDFTGLIGIGGAYQGVVYVTTTSRMIRYVLRAMRELDESDAAILDAVGEIANTIAGNARKHYGEHLVISPPQAIKGAVTLQIMRHRPFIIIVDWKHYQATVVIDVKTVEEKNK